MFQIIIVEKQKSEMLSVEQKYEILQMLEKGQSRKIVAEKYNISIGTVTYIYTHRQEIKTYYENNPVIISRFTKRLPWSRFPNLEKVLYQWCTLCMKTNIELTGIEIQKKALELNEKLYKDPHFRASGNWLQGYRDRYRITSEEIKQNFPTPTTIAADNFKAHFNQLQRDEGFTLENVYNASYTVILWRAVPEGTLIFRRAKPIESQKMCEDHVTILLCANATGCHRLPVLIVGEVVETERTYYFKTNAVQTAYTTNNTAWVNSSVFSIWFEECFLKSVKERQEKNGRREKTLLLLDHARSLPHLNDLNKKDEFVTVISLPRDVTPLRQPMNCGIIASFKRIYRKELMQTLASLQFCNMEDEVIDTHKKLNMWDCCRIAHDAWSYIDNTIMKSSWESLLNPKCNRSADYSKKIKVDVDETVKILRSLPGCEQYDTANVSNWFVIDNTRDLITKIYTKKVLLNFKRDVLREAEKAMTEDEAGPSCSKILKLS